MSEQSKEESWIDASCRIADMLQAQRKQNVADFNAALPPPDARYTNPNGTVFGFWRGKNGIIRFQKAYRTEQFLPETQVHFCETELACMVLANSEGLEGIEKLEVVRPQNYQQLQEKSVDDGDASSQTPST